MFNITHVAIIIMSPFVCNFFSLVNYWIKWWVLDPNDASSSRGFSLANFKLSRAFIAHVICVVHPLGFFHNAHLYIQPSNAVIHTIKRCGCIQRFALFKEIVLFLLNLVSYNNVVGFLALYAVIIVCWKNTNISQKIKNLTQI